MRQISRNDVKIHHGCSTWGLQDSSDGDNDTQCRPYINEKDASMAASHNNKKQVNQETDLCNYFKHQLEPLLKEYVASNARSQEDRFLGTCI